MCGFYTSVSVCLSLKENRKSRVHTATKWRGRVQALMWKKMFLSQEYYELKYADKISTLLGG